MPSTTQRPKSIPNCEISGVISYNLLDSVPIHFRTTATPFAQTMWKAFCGYCEAYCVAYRISFQIDGKEIDCLSEKEYLMGWGGWLN